MIWIDKKQVVCPRCQTSFKQVTKEAGDFGVILKENKFKCPKCKHEFPTHRADAKVVQWFIIVLVLACLSLLGVLFYITKIK